MRRRDSVGLLPLLLDLHPLHRMRHPIEKDTWSYKDNCSVCSEDLTLLNFKHNSTNIQKVTCTEAFLKKWTEKNSVTCDPIIFCRVELLGSSTQNFATWGRKMCGDSRLPFRRVSAKGGCYASLTQNENGQEFGVPLYWRGRSPSGLTSPTWRPPACPWPHSAYHQF